MKHLLLFLENGKCVTDCGTFAACLLKVNIKRPVEFAIVSPDGYLKESRISSLYFIHKIFEVSEVSDNES